MGELRPYVLTIAGFDPSGGAGLTADTKVFEQCGVYGLAICSGITLQTEDRFLSIRWESISDILEALELLLERYPVNVIKTGILPNLDYFSAIVSFVNERYPMVKLIVDPIIRASAGFEILDISSKEKYYELLQKCYLITPNFDEVKMITGLLDPLEAVEELAQNCAVFLKGGHNEKNKGTDYLYVNNEVFEFQPSKISGFSKHGTGCILSAAIASNLALGMELQLACSKAKHYLEKVLESNSTLLGYHHA